MSDRNDPPEDDREDEGDLSRFSDMTGIIIPREVGPEVAARARMLNSELAAWFASPGDEPFRSMFEGQPATTTEPT